MFVDDKNLLKEHVVLNDDGLFEGWVREAHFSESSDGTRRVVIHELPPDHIPTGEDDSAMILNFDFFVPLAYVAPLCPKANPKLYKIQKYMIKYIHFAAISNSQTSLGIFLGNNSAPLVIPVKNEEWTRLQFAFNSKEHTEIWISPKSNRIGFLSKPNPIHIQRKYNLIHNAS